MKTSFFQLLRQLRLFLKIDPGPLRRPADFRQAAVEVAWLARFFYLFIAFVMNTDLRPFGGSGVLTKTPTAPLWPVDLLNGLFGADWLALAAKAPFTPVLCSLLGLLAVAFPGRLIWRLGVFLYLFIYVAAEGSHGATNHGRYFYLYISFALLFLPSGVGRPALMTRKAAMDCLMVFWFAQLLPLLSYSLSGFWKIAHSGLELLSSDGFVRILLSRMMSDTQPVPVLLPFLVKNELLAQGLFLGVIYIQVSAILALFRPHLHRPLGIALMLFHLCTVWLLNIQFHEFAVVLGLLLVFSPFAPQRFSLQGLLQSLPLVGIPLRAFAAQSVQPAAKAWLIYDGECPVCRRYALYLDVKQSVAELVLVNAREGGPIVEEVRALPHDLNKGMVLKMNGRFHRGDEALHVLALLSDRRKAFGALNRLFFHSRAAARLLYPLLKLGRRALLMIKRVPMID